MVTHQHNRSDEDAKYVFAQRQHQRTPHRQYVAFVGHENRKQKQAGRNDPIRNDGDLVELGLDAVHAKQKPPDEGSAQKGIHSCPRCCVQQIRVGFYHVDSENYKLFFFYPGKSLSL